MRRRRPPSTSFGVAPRDVDGEQFADLRETNVQCSHFHVLTLSAS